MANRPPESLKTTASQLVDLIATGNGDRESKAALLRDIRMQLNGSIPEETVSERTSANGNDSVGIWQKVVKNGDVRYRRDMNRMNEWPLWADVHEIAPRTNKKRIALLGESVARGYFYDPHYNVAKELEALLKHRYKLADIEVLDLARTGMGMDALLELAKCCSAFKPEAVVIFAGNNWASGTILPEDYNELSGDHGEGLFGKLKSVLERKLEKKVKAFLKEIKYCLVEAGIPVVFVIPEFNLKDWASDDADRILFSHPANNIVDWIEASDHGEQALKAGDWEKLLLSAEKMVKADPSNPRGYELLAQYHLCNNNPGKARECLEQSRDTAIIGKSDNVTPRCYRVVQRTLLHAAGNYGIDTVDLRTEFKALCPDDIPGRELFLDYCHLTVEGIRIAMQRTALTLAPLLTRGRRLPEKGDAPVFQPDDLVNAVAHFSAAIHNAHYSQSADVIAYHCNKAIAFSREIAGTMIKYADFSTRCASTVLCGSFEEIISGEIMKQYEGGMALRHPRNKKLMDITLVNTIVDALEGAGISVSRQIAALRLNEHGIETEKVDLLKYYYRKNSYSEFSIAPRPDFVQVRTARISFCFVCDGSAAIRFDLVYRTPPGACIDKNVQISLSTSPAPVVELPMSTQWSLESFVIDRALLREGVNELIISWPCTAPQHTAAPAATDLSLKELFLPLGEIHSFTAIAGKTFPGDQENSIK